MSAVFRRFLRGWPGERRPLGEEGFSLPELLVAVLVLSMLVLATFQMLDAQLSESGVVVSRSDIAEELRMAMDTMVDQLRTARSFTAAAESDVTFRGYVLGSESLQTVRFYLSNGNLYMSCPELFSGDKLISDGVTRLSLQYYDSTGSLLNNPDQSLDSIALVEIEMAISRSSGKVTQEESAVTQVRIRK